MNILIIEDDLFLWNNIKKIFDKRITANRIKVIQTYNQFLHELSVINSYDIILVDIMLWDKNKNWIDIIKSIRNKSKKIPIVIISWLQEISRIETWFKNWANDYIVKPFRLKELEVRVMKWFQTFFYSDLSSRKSISYNWLEYDIYSNQFYYKNRALNLTKSNKYLLSLFLSHPEVLLKETYLNEKIWWDISSIIDRNLRVNILRLKNMLKPYDLDMRIQNVRWEWYILKK